MWYAVIFLAIVAVLARRHFQSGDVSERSKRIILGVVVGAVVIAVIWPLLVIAATLVLAGLGAYIILREVARSTEREIEHRERAAREAGPPPAKTMSDKGSG